MPSAEPSAYAPVHYLHSNGNYTWQHFPGGRKRLAAYPIKHLVANHYPGLLRLHRSIAVDAGQVQHLVVNPKGKASYVVLISGTMLPVSRRRIPDVELALRAGQRPPLCSP